MTVMVNGVTLEELNPYGYFERHTYTFAATTGGQATVRFVNTGPAGDQAVFVDDVKVCYVPPTTTTTQTTQLTSTATPTTHTIAQVRHSASCSNRMKAVVRTCLYQDPLVWCKLSGTNWYKLRGSDYVFKMSRF